MDHVTLGVGVTLTEMNSNILSVSGAAHKWPFGIKTMTKTEQQSENRAGILRAISDWLKLLGLIVLAAEAFLTAAILKTGQADPYVSYGIGLFGLIVIGLFYDRYLQVKAPRSDIDDLHARDLNRDGNPEPLVGLIADMPISAQNIARWLGRWNCHWTIHGERGHPSPHVDDGITIQHIDPESGMLRGVGHTAYGSGGTYKVQGRIAQEQIGVFIYSSDESAFSRLDGVFILHMNGAGEVTGSWLGKGRDGTDLEGRVVFERPKDYETFDPQLHPYPPPKSAHNAS